MGPITCLMWIIVGAMAGSFAHQLVGKGSSQGFLPDVALGLIGAFVGGIVLGLFGFQVESNNFFNPFVCVGHLFVATFGASMLILGRRWLQGRA